MDTRPTEGTSARSDQGGPGSARPEGPEVVLTAPHLAGDTRIVREIAGKHSGWEGRSSQQKGAAP